MQLAWCVQQKQASATDECSWIMPKNREEKILIAGGGRHNFTNYDVTAKNFLSQNPTLLNLHWLNIPIGISFRWSTEAWYWVWRAWSRAIVLWMTITQRYSRHHVASRCKQARLKGVTIVIFHSIEKNRRAGFKMHLNTDEVGVWFIGYCNRWPFNAKTRRDAIWL